MWRLGIYPKTKEKIAKQRVEAKQAGHLTPERLGMLVAMVATDEG
jgi:hypothetical protein